MRRREQGEPYWRVSVTDAKKLLDEGGAVVVDVRNKDEYLSGHVKGALFIPVDQVLERIEELPKGKKLLFICAAGVRSGLAAEMAAAMGFQPDILYNIEEGTPTWVAQDLPTSHGTDP